MLSTTLGFPGDMSHRSLLHWRSQVFPKGHCHHDVKEFCESRHNNLLKNVIENMK